MTWWMVILMIVGVYVGGWFTTALAITQVGTVKRGCAPGCTLRQNTRYDHYESVHYNKSRGQEKFLGQHAKECNKPRFELVRAEDAARYALVWPYLWFYGVLAISEQRARKRVEVKQKQDRPPLTQEQLDKILESPNVTIGEDGKIVVLKELES